MSALDAIALVIEIELAAERGDHQLCEELLGQGYDQGLFGDIDETRLNDPKFVRDCAREYVDAIGGQHHDEYAEWFARRFFAADARRRWCMGHPLAYDEFLSTREQGGDGT